MNLRQDYENRQMSWRNALVDSANIDTVLVAATRLTEINSLKTLGVYSLLNMFVLV